VRLKSKEKVKIKGDQISFLKCTKPPGGSISLGLAINLSADMTKDSD